eukprot:1365410-Prymnesium_polylepis.1
MRHVWTVATYGAAPTMAPRVVGCRGGHLRCESLCRCVLCVRQRAAIRNGQCAIRYKFSTARRHS